MEYSLPVQNQPEKTFGLQRKKEAATAAFVHPVHSDASHLSSSEPFIEPGMNLSKELSSALKTTQLLPTFAEAHGPNEHPYKILHTNDYYPSGRALEDRAEILTSCDNFRQAFYLSGENLQDLDNLVRGLQLESSLLRVLPDQSHPVHVCPADIIEAFVVCCRRQG